MGDSVHASAIPQNGLSSFVQKSRKEGFKLLVPVTVMIIFSLSSFLIINGGAAMREKRWLAPLIKQMEATQQAERRNMNKNLTLACASHDIRASLAALAGLIQMSYHEAVPGSELDTNLKQMDSCARDLLGLLNSILDASKIEAGKMELEEEEFDLPQVLEDVVDLFHAAAMKKGVDLVLDPCDASIIRCSRMKGDTGKLKRVLVNLLSNAVKFTDEGHIAVRAWGQKSMTASNRHSLMKHLSCSFYKESERHRNPEAVNAIHGDPNVMNFVFEVDDTGRGIPKEKHKYVFENYVQDKETALGRVGTGLRLGIVQSLVHLMHGDIGIVEEDMGEKGTCFKFNVLSYCV
ncbi:histidine kinase CKI1-like [Prosopis cineraria]|uniref:histidine kinase CKI1-like n=1 Tax=Prosopis cineraria TaxID=364024 RepID=UPI00240ECA47|nr:histidine kinase CKI1-like [Prosopis cineraria]